MRRLLKRALELLADLFTNALDSSGRIQL
jgi:hypothetical protein